MQRLRIAPVWLLTSVIVAFLSVSLPQKVDFSVPLWLSPKDTLSLTVEVRDVNTGSPISRASVYIDGSFGGSTDSTGNVIVLVTYPPENHQISVSASGYETNTGALVVSQSGSAYLTIRLTPISQSGSVTFTVNVVDITTGSPIFGASVQLDGNFQGTTDSKGEVTVSTTYPPSSHYYLVSASGYETTSGSWVIGSNSGGYAIVRLTPLSSESNTPVSMSITTITLPATVSIVMESQTNPVANAIDAILTAPSWETFAVVALVVGFIASVITIISFLKRGKGD